MRFDEFMEQALYGPDGFYAGPGRAGRRGDFLTSVEVGPLFAAVVARMLDTLWERAGSPAEFVVAEAGAGPGTLARGIKAAAPSVLTSGALRYVAVEISSAQRDSHPAWVASQPDLPARADVIVANELLDNLPFRLAVFDGGWREAHVSHDGERWFEDLEPLAEAPGFLPARAPLGARAPLQDRAGRWVDDARRRLAPGGRLIVLDYVTPRTAELTVRPWREWLRTYRAHDRGEHYLRAVGTQDITAQVCLDQVVAVVGEPDALRTQAQFLELWGISELVEEGRRTWEAQAARPGLEAMAARSRIREAEALLDPAGLGGFLVVEWAAQS